MDLITQAVLVHAIRDVNDMNPAQKVQLADEIFLQQPNLLASILVLGMVFKTPVVAATEARYST